MSAVLAPFGFRAARMLGSSDQNMGLTSHAIASGSTPPIFHGDPVIIVASGAARGTVTRFNATVAATTATAAITVFGHFVGCQYTDPVTGQLLQRPFYPGGIAASDIVAFLHTNPDSLFEVQAAGSITQAMIGCNAGVIQSVVNNTTTGNSGVALNAASVESTATLPYRIVDVVRKEGNALGDANTRVLVRVNTHFHRSTTGVGIS